MLGFIDGINLARDGREDTENSKGSLAVGSSVGVFKPKLARGWQGHGSELKADPWR